VRSLYAALQSVSFTNGFSQLNKQPAWTNWHLTSGHVTPLAQREDY